MIRQVKEGYRLYNHSGKNLGTYSSYSDAVKREKQIKMFKHMNQ